MPVHDCTKNGKPGKQWGNQTCYTGPGAEAKAKRQGRAAYASGYKGRARKDLGR